jgi:hypothetical protein
MSTPLLPRLGAGCGVLFPIVLFVASGDGDNAFLAPRAIAGLAALTVAIPFIAYLCSLLREAEGGAGWLATTALTTGVAGIVLKLSSDMAPLALHRAHVADGTQLHKAFEELAGGATVLSLYPLAVFCAATAIVALRTGALPRWLGVAAAVAAAALAVNGAFLEASFLPALLVFMLWTLLAGVHLLRRTRPATAAGRVTATAAT